MTTKKKPGSEGPGDTPALVAMVVRRAIWPPRVQRTVNTGELIVVDSGHVAEFMTRHGYAAVIRNDPNGYLRAGTAVDLSNDEWLPHDIAKSGEAYYDPHWGREVTPAPLIAPDGSNVVITEEVVKDDVLDIIHTRLKATIAPGGHKPADPALLAKYKDFLRRYTIRGRLEDTQFSLKSLEGLPEHAPAKALVDRLAAIAAQLGPEGQHTQAVADEAARIVAEFRAIWSEGQRRKDDRREKEVREQRRRDSVSGGRAAGQAKREDYELDQRNKRLVDTFRSLCSTGRSRQQAFDELANAEVRKPGDVAGSTLSRKQLSRILEQAGEYVRQRRTQEVKDA